MNKLVASFDTCVRDTVCPVVDPLVSLLVVLGVYTVLLAVEDNAGNAEVARRFLVFDNKNVVTINSDDDKQMRMTSAAKNTSYTWVTSLQDTSNAGDKASVLVSQ